MHRRTFLGAASLAVASSLATRQFAHAESKKKKYIDDPTFQPNTLFLTWQRDPTTTMTIQWIVAAGETRSTSVQYREMGQETWNASVSDNRPFPMTGLLVFRCELTNLRPGSDYEFRIGDSSPVWRFRTMPAKATDVIHFMSGGDCGVNEHAIANNIQAARQDPMFVVIGGDIGYDDGIAPDICLSFIRNYSRHMVGSGGRLIPMIPCIGNHEVDGGYGMPREKAPFFYALFDGLFSNTGYAALDFGDYLSLILLDTGHTSSIDGEQTCWLEKTLHDRVDRPHVIVVNHVPAYPAATKQEEPEPGKPINGVKNRQHWVPLFERYRVPVVLEHHDHVFKRTRPMLDGLANDKGVLYLGDGSWGRLATKAKGDMHGYVAATSRDYQLSLHRLQGDERFHLALDERGRVMDTCRSGQRTTGLVRAHSEKAPS